MSKFAPGEVIIPISSNAGFYSDEVSAKMPLRFVCDMSEIDQLGIDIGEISFKSKMMKYNSVGLVDETYHLRQPYTFIAFNDHTVKSSIIQPKKEINFIPINNYL